MATEPHSYIGTEGGGLDLLHKGEATFGRPPLCSFVAMWRWGYVAMRLCGFMAVWLCGYVAMWLYGFSEICAHDLSGGRLLMCWSDIEAAETKPPTQADFLTFF